MRLRTGAWVSGESEGPNNLNRARDDGFVFSAYPLR